MRKLQFQDAFKMANIIKRANLKESLTSAYKSGKKEEASTEEIGVEVFFSILEAAGTEGIDEQIYELLGDITEKGADKVKTESIEAILEDFSNIAKENNLEAFFKLVQRSMK